MLIVVDVLVGIWLTLHTRGALSSYLAPQLPAIGFGALCWGFLPDSPKKAFGEWLVRVLVAAPVYRTIIAAGSVALLGSLFVSTVIVESVDPAVSTRIHIARGTPGTGASDQLETPGERRLNRLTTPLREHFAILPLGEQVWAFSPTHVTTASQRLMPWRPVVLQYPDDFEPMAAVEVLPSDPSLDKLSRGNLRLQLKTEDAGGSVLAEGVLLEGSTRIAFTEPAPLADQTIARWKSNLERVEKSPEYVRPMLDAWRVTHWMATRRPLRLNDRLYYEVSAPSGTILSKGQLTLNDVVTTLDLSL